MKNVLAVFAWTVVFLSDTCEGSMHDKTIAEATPYPLPPGSELLEDLGFLGLNLDSVHHRRPHKKPKGKGLTPQQKEHNRAISRRRIVIEHIISSVKRCRIVKDTIRLYNNELRDLVMEVCCGLHNFRVRLTPWPQR